MDAYCRDQMVELLQGIAALSIVRDAREIDRTVQFLQDFEQVCPYKGKDRVVLVDPPDCNGPWEDAKHFLIPGARATVGSVEWFHTGVKGRKSGWLLLLVFDDETRISKWDSEDGKIKAGTPVPVEPQNRRGFKIAAERVRPLNPEFESLLDNLEAGQL